MGRKRLRKAVTETFIPRKIKKERDPQPTRFSKRLRRISPSFTSYSEVLRNPVKYIKTEKVIGEYERSILNQESSAQFMKPSRTKRRKIRYPPRCQNSKQVYSILSAPKVSRCNTNRHLRSGHNVKQEIQELTAQIRGSNFKTKVAVKKTKCPIVNDVLTISKMKTCQNQGSPLIRNRKKYVLEILNHGDQKDIEKLHSVGSKTAERILLFRQLKGTISKISELTLMPKFTKSRFNNFVQQNFLNTLNCK